MPWQTLEETKNVLDIACERKLSLRHRGTKPCQLRCGCYVISSGGLLCLNNCGSCFRDLEFCIDYRSLCLNNPLLSLLHSDICIYDRVPRLIDPLLSLNDSRLDLLASNRSRSRVSN